MDCRRYYIYPLYFHKGLYFTSIQYLTFTIIAILGFFTWLKELNKKTNCKRIVIYGPESTGKTTLANDLANHYKTKCAPEYAREYLQKKWDLLEEKCNLNDLINIALGQINLENKIVSKSKKFIFCDTNILVTKVWSETHFSGYCSPEIIKILRSVSYDYYLLTNIDVPWVKDDLRDRQITEGNV